MPRCRLRSFPPCAAFPRSQYYDRSAPLLLHQPQAGPSSVRGQQQWFPGSVSYRHHLTVGPLYTPIRCSLHRRWTRLAYTPVARGYQCQIALFPGTIRPGTAHLSPSLPVDRLVQFQALPTRVPRVAIARLRLAASGQGRVCHYPRVSRASGCLGLLVHNLPGQPLPRGGVGGFSSITSFLSSFHCMTQLPGAHLSTENRPT